MALNNDSIIQAAVGIWSGNSAITLPEALSLMVANTSLDKSDAHIDNFLGELLTGISDLAKTPDEFEDVFGTGATLGDVDFVVVNAVRDLTTERYARVETETFPERLAEYEVVVSSDDGLVFRLGHIDFWANENGTEKDAYMVPSSLMIRRSHLNKKIESVRSVSSPVAIAPDPIEAISVDLIFPNVKCLNERFREIYSMTQMLPVFTIDSPLITKAFINETDFPKMYNRVVAEIINNDQKLSKDLKAAQKEALSSLDNAVELSRTDDPFVDHIIDRIAIEAENTLYGPEENLPEVETLVNRVSTAVGVALKSITLQSLPGQPGAIMARLSFTRANIPMLEKGQPLYLDINGRPTHSVQNAHWLKKFSRTLMNKNIAKDRFLEPIDVNEPGWDDFELTWENIFGQEKTISLNTEVSTESQFNFITGFKVVPLNILNASSPLVQHMGRNNLEGVLVLETTDQEFVASLSAAKAEIAQEAKLGYVRRNSALIKHPVVNMLGVKRVSIKDIAIQESQDNPGLISVTLGLIENALNIEDVESLQLEQGALDVGAIEILWDFARRLSDYETYLMHEKPQQHEAWVAQLDDAESNTRNFIKRMLYGSGEKKPGIMRMPIHESWFTVETEGKTFTDFDEIKYAPTKAGIVRLYKSMTGKRDVKDIMPYLHNVAKIVGDWATCAPGSKANVLVNAKERDVFSAIGYDIRDDVIKGRPIVFDGDTVVKTKTTITPNDSYIIDRQPTPRALWDSILEATFRARGDKSGAEAWSARDLKAAMAVLAGIVNSGMVDSMVSIPKEKYDLLQSPAGESETIVWKYRDYLKEKESPENVARRNKAATNYTDMVLPTYDELFAGAIDSEYQPLWKKFAPTYSDLGTKPPLNDKTAFLSISDAFNSCAHTEFDLVSPGAFFYKPRVKEFIHEAAQELHDESFDQTDYAEVLKVPINYDSILDKLGVDNFADANNSAIEEIVLSGLGKGPAGSGVWTKEAAEYEKFRNDENVRVIDVVDNEGRPVLSFTKDVDGKTKATVSVGKRNIFSSRAGDPVFDPQSKKDVNKMFYSSIEHTPDNTSNADKSFPAIRIYLVEEDRRYRALFDDLYAVSAIESVSVTRDHMDADTAVIKLANTSGYLSEDSFIPKSANDEIDDDGEPLLNRFKVTYGTHIVVKMGYASRPEDLKTVFTGAVAEVMGGDSITMIAQSFQTELLNEVGVFQEYWTWDLADRPHLRNVLNKVLRKNGDAPHLGRNIVLDDPHSEEAAELLDDLYGTYSGVDTKWYRNPLRYAAEAWGGAVHSDITRNVYMDSNTSFQTEFVVPTMPTMDAIRECTRYVPNFIADVVPYGVDGTLFVGDPGSQYKYRDIDSKEKELYELAAAEEQKDLFTLSGAFGDMIRGFMSSDNFTDYKASLARANEEVSKGRLRALDIDRIGFDNATGMRNWLAGDYDGLSVTDYQRDIIKEVKEQEKGIDGLHRRAFCFFYGLNPNTISWPRGVRAGWRNASEALLSPWYNYAKDEPTASFKNAVSYLNPDARDRTRNTISSEEVWFSKRVEGYGTTWDENAQAKFRTIFGFGAQAPNDLSAFENSGTDSDLEQVVLPGSGAERIKTEQTKEGTYIVNHLYASALEYRIFMLHLMEYLQANESTNFSEKQKSRVFAAELPPGYKSFRDYHLVTSEQDIIENNITASDSEMWTAAALKAPAVVEIEGVWSGLTSIIQAGKGIDDPIEIGENDNLVIMSPDQDYTLWPAEANIPGEGNREGLTFRGVSPTAEDILKIFHEPNATTPFAASIAICSRLCEGMSKMYRGNIIIAGKAIKPYDIVHIRDQKNNIMGNIVAERVTHNFDPNFGWTTTIIPKAATYHNSNFSYETASFWSEMWNAAVSDELNNALLFVTLAGFVATVLTGGAALPAFGTAFLAAMGNTVRTAGTRVIGQRGRDLLQSAAGTAFTRAAANMGTRISGAQPLNYLAARTGRITSAYLGHTILQAGDRSVGRAIRAMTETALAQRIGGDKYPVLVNTLVYQGRPYTAGFKPDERDFNNEFWENFSAMLKDFGQGVDAFFKGGEKIDADGTIRDIIGND